MLHTLTGKVSLAAVVFLTLLTLVAVVVISGIMAVNQATQHVTDGVVTYLNANSHFNEDMDLIASDTQFYVLTRDQTHREEVQESVEEATAALPILAQLSAQTTPVAAQFQQEFAALHAQRVQLVPLWNQAAQSVMQAADSNDPATLDRALSIFAQLDDQVQQLEDDSDALLVREVDVANSTIRQLTQRGLLGSLSGLLITAAGMVLILLLLRQRVVQPIIALSTASHALAAGDLQQPIAVTQTDELGVLQRNFNLMTGRLAQQLRDLEAQVLAATQMQAEAEIARADLATQLATVEEQREVIRAMSVPILPLSDAMLVMPLVGALDAERLQLVQEQALHALERTPARHLILDITGVPVVDTAVAQGLLQVVQSARLLGTQVVLVGIRPEVAQALVGLGLSLNGLRTSSTLQSGISAALHQGIPAKLR